MNLFPYLMMAYMIFALCNVKWYIFDIQIDEAKETKGHGKIIIMYEEWRTHRKRGNEVQRYKSSGTRPSFDATMPLCVCAHLLYGKESERDEEQKNVFV